MSTGVISFGLVNIPVKVYSANESSGKISFNQLHSEKKIRLRQQMIDPETGDAVPKDKIVKGYEYAKDQYLVISDEELEKFEQASSRAMEITEFVPLDAIDPLYFDSGYFLTPENGAERAYRLLVVALTEMKFAAVAKYTARGKQTLIALRPMQNALVMQQLRFKGEVKSLTEIPLPADAPVSDAELTLARQLIQTLAKTDFDLGQYHDEYREQLQAYLDKRVKGEAVTFEAAPAPAAKVVDLMEALKASLAKGSADGPPPVPKAAEQARKPPKKAPKREGVAKKSSG